MKEEERRISPAILIVPVALGLGLAVVGLALARAAPPKEYVCPYCGAKFSTEAEALAHIEMEHPEEPPIVYYTCTICGATFTTQEELDTHILSEHPEEVPEIPSGEILEMSWWSEALASWRPITEPMPAYTYVTYRFRVKNTGNTVGTFKVGYSWYSEFAGRWEWSYSPSFNIEADTEGNIDWELLSGPGTYTITFHLFSNDNDVDSLTVTITVV